MEWGDRIDFLNEEWRKRGVKPKALQRMVPLPSRLTFFMNAFDDLVNDRQIFTGGASPIPFTAVDRWAQRYGVEGDQFERLVRMVRALDRVWLADYARKLKEASRRGPLETDRE